MLISTEKEQSYALDGESLISPVSGNISPSERRAFHDSVAERGAVEPDFRSNLLTNPRDTLNRWAKEYLGRDLGLSEDAQVFVLDDSIEALHIIVPQIGSKREAILEIGELTSLIRRAASDPLFRDDLITNPNGVVRAYLEKLGTALPEFVQVHLTEIGDNDVVVFLPPAMHVPGKAAFEVTASSAMGIQAGWSMYECDTRNIGCSTPDSDALCETRQSGSCPYYTIVPRC